MRPFRRKSAPSTPALAIEQAEADFRAYVAAAPERHAAFLAETEEVARRVLMAASPAETYEAASSFLDLALPHSPRYPEASGLAYIWPCLTDGMDASGTGGPAPEAQASHQMKQAAQEWLVALPDAQARQEYIERWVDRFRPDDT